MVRTIVKICRGTSLSLFQRYPFVTEGRLLCFVVGR